MLRLSPIVLLCVLATAGGSTRAEDNRVHFLRDVMPVLTKLHCSECHREGRANGRLKFSLRGSDPAADYAALMEDPTGRRVSLERPAESRLVRWPPGFRNCRGFQQDSPAYRILLRWIEQGAPGINPESPRLITLRIEALDRPLQPGDSVPLKAIAQWSDNRRTDVTQWAIFAGGNSEVAKVASDGKLTIDGPGFATVTAQFLDQIVALPLRIAFDDDAAKIDGPQDRNVSRPNDRNVDGPKNRWLDQHMADVWREVRATPTAAANDKRFCRRAYLQLVGRMPSPDELIGFVRKQDEGKRADLVTMLLQEDQYADHWAEVWADWLLDEHAMEDAVRPAFVTWLSQQLRQGQPLDEIVRKLLTAKGTLKNNGAIGPYLVHPSAEAMGATTARVFLGTRLQCARCHPHLEGPWTPADFRAVADPFQGIWQKGTEPDAEAEAVIEGNQDQRKALADRITRERERELARSLVNRYWAELFGQGLVEPVDDIRPSNPASHPELLEELTTDLLTHRFDARHLLRLLCTSRTYQVGSGESKDRWFYSSFPPQRLKPWVLSRAIQQVVGLPSNSTDAMSHAVPGALRTTGSPNRSGCTRGFSPWAPSGLVLLTNNGIAEKLSDKNGRVARLLASGKSDARIIEEFYLATLARSPTLDEQRAIKAHLMKTPRRKALEDVLWALMNCKEFVFIQ